MVEINRNILKTTMIVNGLYSLVKTQEFYDSFYKKKIIIILKSKDAKRLKGKSVIKKIYIAGAIIQLSGKK